MHRPFRRESDIRPLPASDSSWQNNISEPLPTTTVQSLVAHGRNGGTSPSSTGKGKERLLQASILAALVVVSSFSVASLLPGGGLWGLGRSAPPVTVPPPGVGGLGRLQVVITVVNVHPFLSFLLSPGNLSTTTTAVIQISTPSILPSNLTFTAVPIQQRFPFRHAFEVNEPGSAGILLAAGNYSVGTTNPYYNISTFVEIQTGNTTTLSVQVTTSTYSPDSSYLVDTDRSGYAGPWGDVDLLFYRQNPQVYAGESVYLLTQSVSYSGGSYSLISNVAPANVVQETTGPQGSWVSLGLRSVLPVRGQVSMGMAEISSSYLVINGA